MNQTTTSTFLGITPISLDTILERAFSIDTPEADRKQYEAVLADAKKFVDNLASGLTYSLKAPHTLQEMKFYRSQKTGKLYFA